MAKVDKYIILSYDSSCNFIGYLSAFSASGANQFAPQIHQAIPFDKPSDCIYSHGQEWEEGRSGKKGHYEHRIYQVEDNSLNEFEQKILEVFKLPLTYDNHGQFIVDAEEKKVADVRGWGTLQYHKDAEQLQDKLGEMLVEAFNEKYGQGNDGYENDPTITTKIEMDGRGGLIIDSVHEIFTFNKEPNGNWYIVLPDWEGSKEDLQMVMGADTMLDRFSEGEDTVKLLISETDFENSYYLKQLKETPEYGGGATYSLYDNSDEFIMDVWLCRVTEHVFSKLPMNIYVHPVRI